MDKGVKSGHKETQAENQNSDQTGPTLSVENKDKLYCTFYLKQCSQLATVITIAVGTMTDI